MELKTILNKCHSIRPFLYGSTTFEGDKIHGSVHARKGSQGQCGECGRRGPIYDTAREPRRFEFVPLWGFAVFLLYTMRRINCPTCGVKTERVPWAEGKNQCCNAYRLFLARWARRIPWSEAASIFGTTWNVVCRSIRWVVDFGLSQRDMSGIQSIGVDEVSIWKGHKYLTVVYQIDEGARRLLFVGKERTEETLRGFFEMLGEERSKLIEFVASDMWKQYITVIKEKISHALRMSWTAFTSYPNSTRRLTKSAPRDPARLRPEASNRS